MVNGLEHFVALHNKSKFVQDLLDTGEVFGSCCYSCGELVVGETLATWVLLRSFRGWKKTSSRPVPSISYLLDEGFFAISSAAGVVECCAYVWIAAYLS